MDYRDRNPIISMWEGPCITEVKCVFPFDPPTTETLFQFQTTQEPTTFLAIHGGFTKIEEDALETVYYLVESSPDCKMRKDFILGRITWEEFWYHRGWLIELKSQSVFDSFAMVSYVHPNGISEDAKRTIRENNHISPLQSKYETLVCCLQGIRRTAAEQQKAEKALQDFLKIYHGHVDLNAA